MNTEKKSVNILYNIQNIKKGSGGIYQYSLALLKIIAKGNFEGNIYVLINNPDSDIESIVESSEKINYASTKFSKVHYLQCICNKIYNITQKIINSSRRKKCKDIFDVIIKNNKIDIIHTPTQHIVRKPNVKTISTIHDVQELHFPEFFTSTQRAYRAVHYKNCIENADTVVVSYNHIKNDIIRYFKISEEKVSVILLDMQDLWFNKIQQTSKKTLEKFNLPKSYLLYPAATWEHKNHLRLLRALDSVSDEIKLVLTGNRTEYYEKVLFPYIVQNNLQNRVISLGIVSDEELHNLYHSCKAVIIPTLYEAGSFPLMESIILGIPVICSNVTSLPETIGNYKFIFDPLDVSDIAKKIQLIMSNDEYRFENLQTINIQAEKLKNNGAFDKILKLYTSLLEK